LNFRVKPEVLFILVNMVIRRMACELLLMQSIELIRHNAKQAL
jgi:hypothetical protein